LDLLEANNYVHNPANIRASREETMANRFAYLALFALVGISPTQAQMTVDLTKVTCKQFVTYEITDARSLSLWLSGYFNAQRKNTTVDVSAFRKKSNALKDYCLSHFETPLMDAAKTVVDLKP
jgi:acid stress chaperone HdeB